MRKDITVPLLVKAMNKLGHAVFEHDQKPFNLNVVGIRAANPKVNEFNGLMTVFWKYEGNWNLIMMQCTTLPGLYTP